MRASEPCKPENPNTNIKLTASNIMSPKCYLQARNSLNSNKKPDVKPPRLTLLGLTEVLLRLTREPFRLTNGLFRLTGMTLMNNDNDNDNDHNNNRIRQKSFAGK